MSNTLKGYISAMIVAFLWGLSFIATKLALTSFNPIGVITVKFLLSSVMFTFLFLVRKENIRIPKEDRKYFLISAFFGSFLYFFFEGMGVNLLNASSASLVIAIEPIVVMVMSYFFVNERINRIKQIAIAVSIIGVWLIVRGGSGDDSLLGFSLMFFAVLSWSIYVIQSSVLTKKYSEVFIAGIQSFVALALYLPFMFMIEVYQFDLWSVLSLLYIGLIPSGIALFLYIYSLRTIGNTTTSMFVNFVPVFASIVGVLFLGESFTLSKVMGGLLIMTVITLTLVFDLKSEKSSNID